GEVVAVEDSAALAEGLIAVLGDAALRDRHVKAANLAVQRYDWSVVADEIMRVYETVASPGIKVTVAGATTRSPG
ncbi:MAG: glycosyltransferase family 4 protein, partial [Mycobacterium sp.]|nr:glycosyltransferase family 4 protein [Mycobacterium sp.]